MKNNNRKCGILVHPISFPSPFGIGDLGEEARIVLNKFADAGIKLWQILPLGPTGFGNSPYSALSTFAGNEYLIDLRSVDGFEVPRDFCSCSSNAVNYGDVFNFKLPLLKQAAVAWYEKNSNSREFNDFCTDNSDWLDDYALYRALAEHFNDTRWYTWPEEIKLRKPKALNSYSSRFEKEILVTKVLQFLFEEQWNKLRDYAHGLGIEIIGDVPIYVGSDSADAWSNRSILKIDAKGNQTAQAGCPPDAFDAGGQLWGNPVYDWKKLEQDDFKWWIRRIEKTSSRVDYVRIDHFRGLASYWEIPAGAESAISGKWVEGPRMKLVSKLSEFKIIAEDLGTLTEDVFQLLEDSKWPGMRVFQFAFEFDGNGKLRTENPYLPHNCTKNCVAYTGTHDNQTTRGWFNSCSESMKDIVRRYLQCPDEEVVWQAIRSLLSSSADIVVIPLQDVLGFDDSARMNKPSTVGSDNWSWRFNLESLEKWKFDRLKSFIDLYR